jgi:hypothetical protein
MHKKCDSLLTITSIQAKTDFTMKTQTCIELTDLAFPIKLEQTSKNRFRVTYGEQVISGLSYSQACTELGASIMHALACDGKIKNGTDAL